MASDGAHIAHTPPPGATPRCGGQPRLTMAWRLGLHVCGLALTCLVLAWLVVVAQAYAAAFLVVGLGVAQGLWLNKVVQAGHRRLVHFVTALRHDDVAAALPAGPDPLSRAMSEALVHRQEVRAEREAEAAALTALIEHVPVALVAIDEGERISPLNAAARRLFAQAPGAAPSDTLATALKALTPGDTQLVRLAEGGAQGRVKLTASEVTARGARRRLVSIENIESELDAMELGAWHDLVRVLTHEMMNSLTPVSSLAGTVRGLLEDVTRRRAANEDVSADLADIGDAVDTIGRRAAGLLHFVQGYRRLTRVPAPSRQRFPVAEVFDRLHQLMAPDFEKNGVTFTADVTPPGLTLDADCELLEQALINLLRNAVDALGGQAGGSIRLTAQSWPGGAVVISVADNGPGVNPNLAGQIFVPFFTTKPSGSGVGLSITRQIMAAHGGALTLGASQGGGAVFTLRFPSWVSGAKT